MANPNIQIDVGGNTAKLQRDINKVANTPITIDVKSGRTGSNAPLGRISGDVAEIDKSLAAANARVVAFAASASVIYGLESAVRALVATFVNVEKKLADVNVLLNLSNSQLSAFGSSLFSIAGNTAQSFDTVAEAATELARQGLGVEETLKRTNDALVLTRLSGLDAASSVKALTAAINSFSDAGLTSTEVINKLANVDAGFAVSSADLANAISRVGSSASDAGVSFDELIALVTTAQQVTSRGGAVIGNSLKTIFTRLGRSETQGLLQNLGVSLTDESGKLKNQVQLLQDLAKIYDTLPQLQKNQVAEQVGGVFQINVLKAALGDLGKEYSIYNQALQTSITSTDQAIQRNERLNQTLSARGAQALTGIQQAGITIAEPLFKPLANNVLNIADLLTDAVNNADASGIGARIGRGLLEGLGNFIGGPGLALITAALGKLFAQFSKVGVEAFKSILGTNTAAKEQAAIQASVAKYLQQNAGLYAGIQKGQITATSAAQQYLTVIQQQTLALQQQAAVAQQITGIISKNVKVQSVGGSPLITPKGAKFFAGFVPNFADPNVAAEIAGAKSHGYKPGRVVKERVYDGTGKSFVAYRNLAETRTDFINSDGKKATMIAPPNGFSKDTMTAFSGFIPNFAQNPTLYELQRRLNSKKITDQERAAIQEQINSKKPISINLNSNSMGGVGSKYGLLFAQEGAGAARFSQSIGGKDTPKLLEPLARAGRKGTITAGLRYRSIFPPDPSGVKSASASFSQKIDQFLQPGFEKLASDIASGLGGTVSSKPENVSSLLPPGAKGTIFEKAVSAATRKPGPKLDKNVNDNAPFDFDPISSYPLLSQLFGKNIGSAVEAKIGKAAAANIPNKILNREPGIARKILQEYMPKKTGGTKTAYSGFVPNFADALKQAIQREKSAGIPSSKIYLSQEEELAALNPFGLGVFNKKDEPNKIARKSAMAKKGFSSGYVPNFALETENLPANSGSGMDLTMMLMSLTIAASMMADSSKNASVSFKSFVTDFKEGKGGFLKALASGTVDLAENSRAIESTTKNIDATKNLLTSTTISDKGRSKLESILQKNEKALRQQQLNTRIGGYQENIKSRGLGYGFAAQALSGVAAQMMGGADTKGGSIATALGNVAGFAGVGASFGPMGAAVGAAVGALTSIPQVISSFNDNLKEASMAAAKAATALADFDTSTQAIMQADEKLSSIRAQGGSPEAMQRANDEFYNALAKLPESIQSKLAETSDASERRDIIAQQRQSLLNEANISKLGEIAAEKISFSMGDILGESASLFGSGGFGMDKKSASAIGSDLAKLIGIGDGAKSAEEGLKKFANGMPILSKAQGEFGKILEQRATDETLMDRGVRQMLGGDDTEKARKVFSDMITELAAQGGDIPDAVRNFADNINNASISEIQSMMSGFSDSFLKQMDKLNVAVDLQEKAKAAFKALPQAAQDYINNVADNIRASTILDFSQLENIRLNEVAVPKFAEEVKRFGEDFFNQFTNASSFIKEVNPLERVKKDLQLGTKELEIASVSDFATEFIPSLNNTFKELLGNKITGEDIAYVSYGMEQLRDNIINAKSLTDIGSFEDLVSSAAGIRPLRESPELKSAFQDAMGKSIASFDSAMQNLNFENEKARVQAGLNSAINNFQKAMQNLDALPRADLTGFVNPFKEAARSRNDLIRQYNESDADIAEQYRNAIKGTRNIENPSDRRQAINEIERQRSEAVRKLNENFNRSMSELANQVDGLKEAAAREMVGFVIAGGGSPDLVNRAISNYIGTIRDRIKEYAQYLGVSASEVERLMTQKLQKDAGMIPDGFGGMASEIKKWMDEAAKIQIKAGQAGEGLTKLISQGPSAGEAVEQLLSRTNNVATSLKSAEEAVKSADIGGSLKNVGTEAGNVAAALSKAAANINNIKWPTSSSNTPISNRPAGGDNIKASGYIPNFAAVSKSNINKSKKLEKNVTGKPAKFYKDPFPHVRNSSQPTFQSAMKDHGGLKKALIDSKNLQENYQFGQIKNFAALSAMTKEALQDTNIDKNLSSKYLKIYDKFGKEIQNFAAPQPLNTTPGNASQGVKNAFRNVQELASIVSQNLGLGFDRVGQPKSINWTNLGRSGAQVDQEGNVSLSSTDFKQSRGFLLKMLANEATHVNQLASTGGFKVPGSLRDHANKLKRFEEFLTAQGAMVETKYGMMAPWKYESTQYADSKAARDKATTFQKEGFLKSANIFKTNTSELMSSAISFAVKSHNDAQKRIISEANKRGEEMVKSRERLKEEIKKINQGAIDLFKNDNTQFVASETRHQEGSEKWLIERFSSLMDAFTGGIQIGRIIAEEMVPPRIAKDIKQGEHMVSLVTEAEEMLANEGFPMAKGYIPNFAINKSTKLNERLSAKNHGYMSGQVNEKLLWNGAGQSMKGVVNSAEKIVDFRNSRGYKATMVMPPNGFAGGFSPNGMMSPSTDKDSAINKSENKNINLFASNITSAAEETEYFTSSTQNFVKDTDLMTQSVKDAVNAINNFADTALSTANQNISVEPQVNVQAPNVNVEPPNITVEPTISSNLTLSNPVVSPTFNVQVQGLGGVESSIADIKSTLVNTIQSQASRIDFLNQQLRELKFSIAKQSI